MSRKQWCDLPSELLSPIAEKLELIDLLRFRAVCKDFLSASSTATAGIGPESVSGWLWFLIYGERCCTLLTSNGKTHNNLRIKELEGATCLASREGWLLVFRKGCMFFFNPFSHARMDLPQFPESEISDHIAAFSSPPTSRDCTVVVLNRSDDVFMELKVLTRGSNQWTTLVICFPRMLMDTFKGAVYHGHKFCFLSEKQELYCWNQKQLDFVSEIDYTPGKYNVSIFSRALTEFPPFFDSITEIRIQKEPLGLRFGFHPVRKLHVKEMLGLDDYVPISTCGTVAGIGDLRTVIYSENLNSTIQDKWVWIQDKWVWIHGLKGVWIEPRFLGSSINNVSW